MTRRRRHASAAHHAFVKGLTSFIVGVLIFIGLALLRLPPLVGPFVRHVEVLGVDLGIYAENLLRSVRPSASGGTQHRYVFFDLDADICSARRESDPVCAPTAPTDRSVVAKMVREARDSGALLVVLDIATTWPAPAADDPLTAALLAPPSAGHAPVPVVLPLLAELRLRPQNGGDSATYAIRPLRAFSGPLNLPPGAPVFFGLPFGLSGEPEWGSGVVRAYARSMQADAMTAGAGARAYWTAAGLAACLVEHPEQFQRCRDADHDTTPERIHFSIGSMVLRSPDDPRNGATGWWTARLRASDELANSDPSLEATPLLHGSIVVIGSSRDLRDYHGTPLGQMTGAEIILNAIRSFLEYRPVGEVGLIGSLLAELPIIACTAAVFAAFWWWASQPGRRSPASHAAWHRRMRDHVVRIIGFLFTCMVAAGCAFLVALLTVLLQSVSRYDIVTPVLITALEGTVEGMHSVILWVEETIESALHRVTDQWKRYVAAQPGKDQ